MLVSKDLLGQVISGCWKIEKVKRKKGSSRTLFRLRNIYNKHTLDNVDKRTIIRILNGECDVCNLVSHRMRKQHVITKIKF